MLADVDQPGREARDVNLRYGMRKRVLYAAASEDDRRNGYGVRRRYSAGDAGATQAASPAAGGGEYQASSGYVYGSQTAKGQNRPDFARGCVSRIFSPKADADGDARGAVVR